MDESRLITLKVFDSRSQADIAAATLRAYGIETTLASDDAGGMLPLVGSGVKLLVMAEQADAANRILQYAPSETTDGIQNPYSGPPPGTPVVTGKDRLIFALLIGILIGGAGHWLVTTAGTWGERVYPYDLNRDGRDDEVWVYANGKPLTRKVDENRDGSFDYREFYEDGAWARYEGDANRDGKLDRWASCREEDLSVTERVDADFDGEPDGVFYYVFNQLQRVDWSPNGTTNIVKREHYKHGGLQQELHDLDRDGRFDISIRFDFEGNPVSTNPVLRSLESSP